MLSFETKQCTRHKCWPIHSRKREGSAYSTGAGQRVLVRTSDSFLPFDQCIHLVTDGLHIIYIYTLLHCIDVRCYVWLHPRTHRRDHTAKCWKTSSAVGANAVQRI